MKGKYLVCLIALLGAMIVITPTAASPDPTTLYVNTTGWWSDPAQFNASSNQIQAAIDNATDGDTIFVYNGTYSLTPDSSTTVDLYLNKPNLTLEGEGADVVTLDGNGGEAIGVGFLGSTAPGCVIKGFRFINCGMAVDLTKRAPNCIISNNVVKDMSHIAISTSAPNTTIVGNVFDGGELVIWHQKEVSINFTDNVISNTTKSTGCVRIDVSSSAVISNNTILKNNASGIILYKCGGNIVTKNKVSSNGKGIWLFKAYEGNKIYLNNFVDNTGGNVVVRTPTEHQFWNSTEPIEYTHNGNTYTNYLGNYWSDYSGVDANVDGIGDTPYDIAGIDNDYHPLMEPWETFFTPPALPELTVTAITPATLYRNLPNTITATIKNNGGNADDSFNVSLKAGDLVIATETVDSLYAEKTIDFSWTPGSTGTVSLTVTVDSENVIEESDETNNAMTESAVIEIPYPDLHPTSLIPPAVPYLNEPNTVTATIRNSGVISADSFSISLVVDNVPVETLTLDPLEVGDEQNVEFSWTPASTGTVSLTVTVDPDNLIEEFDETNNNLSTHRFVTILGYDWKQFHYDITNIGFSSSYAPGTNETLWISEDIGAAKGTSTVVAEGKVFANCGNSLTAMDIFTGELLWSTSLDSTTEWGSWLSPSYHDGKVFISGKSVYCINAGDGAIIWKYKLQTSACNAGTSVADGKVFASDWDGHHYYCLDEETGELLWMFDVGSYAQSVPAVADGKIYLSDWGTMYCLDMDGTEIWRHSISGHWAEGGNFAGSPAVSNGVLYAGTYNFYGDGSLSALNATDGTLLWSKTIQRTDSTPVVAYGNVYITGGCSGFSGKQTYCFDATTGDLEWTTDPAEAIGGWTCSVAVADSKVFVGKPGGYFDYTGTYALDAFTGDVIWSYPAGGASPAIADGIVFTIGEGRVYAFYTVPASVTFDCKKLDLNSNGIIKAFITLPEGYDVADINVTTVECEGAYAFGDGSVIPGKQALEVKFRIQDLVDVPIGDAVLLSVTGELTTGERFEGSNTVKVTAK